MSKIKITICLCAIIVTSAMILLIPENEGTRITDLHAETRDNCVVLSWDSEWRNLLLKYTSTIKIEVSGIDYINCYYIVPSNNEFIFSDGEDGKGYSFHVSAINKNYTICEADSIRAIFVDFNNLPNLPLIKITTENYKEPTCEYISAPNEMCMGESIINNKYVHGDFSMSQTGKTDINQKIKMKIRGNTSAYSDKKPYKIVLEKPVDLLQRESTIYADTDWLLIKYNDLDTPVGNYISQVCGMEWQPQFEFVNVMINGDWKGSYLLVEAVGKGNGKINISDSGFIIENDAYWWNEDGKYFKSYSQILIQPECGGFGFTYKYPTPSMITEKDITRIKNFVDEFEYVLYNNPKDRKYLQDMDYAEYIDVDSFVSWVLAHDILGTWDYGGSNIFLYKSSLFLGNENISKMKIGPTWDFDSNYMNVDEWSNIHINIWFYYSVLFQNDSFISEYADKWNTISGSIVSDVVDYFNTINNEYGDEIQKSLNLDAERWEVQPRSLEEYIAKAESWFYARTLWMEKNIANMEKEIAK